MILQSGIIDPLEKHINIVRWLTNLSSSGVDLKLHPRNIIKSMKVLTQMLISPFRNCVLDIVTEANIDKSFPTPTCINVDIGAVQIALKRPEYGTGK